MDAEQQIKENAEAKIKSINEAFKRKSRENALMYSPNNKVTEEGREEPLTAKEKIGEAEVVYQWLIKDL